MYGGINKKAQRPDDPEGKEEECDDPLAEDLID
jgi:hypothetical protein